MINYKVYGGASCRYVDFIVEYFMPFNDLIPCASIICFSGDSVLCIILCLFLFSRSRERFLVSESTFAHFTHCAPVSGERQATEIERKQRKVML